MAFVKDKAKCTIFAAELSLKLVNLSLDDRSICNTACFFIITLVVAMHVGLMYTCLLENNSMDAIANTLGLSNGGLQAMIKATALFYHREKITSILEILQQNFWPANIVDPKTEERIWTVSKMLLLLFAIQYANPIMSLSFFMIVPILKGNRYLPFTYCLLSDKSRQSPTFEMLYAFQVVAAILLPVNIVGGYDYLYTAACSNCSAQFRLLHSAIRIVGTGNEEEMIERLLKLPGVEVPPAKIRGDKARILLVICIRHHQNLLRLIDTLNEVFEGGIFMQFVFSLAGICANCYLLSLQTSLKASVVILILYAACLLQLLFFCAFSDNLSHLSVDLADSAYESMWYKNDNPDIRRCLMLVILRSQKAVSMNAFGLFQLNYVSFVGVVRFSFSLYTFLSQVAT